MRYRIAMWACAGFLVAGCWVIYMFAFAYGFASRPASMASAAPVRTLLGLTCPIALVGIPHALGLAGVLLANAATYALLGLIVETLRQRLRRAH
jgi:hypothetical protein